MGNKVKNLLCEGPVCLRAVESSDADFLFDVENDTSHWKENGLMAPVSRDFMSIYAATYEPDIVKSGQLRLIVELRETAVSIGVVDLFDIDWKNLHAETGIYIVKKYRKNGYATSALNAMCRYAFEILGINSLIARIVESNSSSKEVFQKAGFSYTGLLSGWQRTPRGFEDVSIYIRHPQDELLPF